MLWGEQSFVNTYDVPAVWAEYVADPKTACVRAGHFLPEEAPAEVLEQRTAFLNDAERVRDTDGQHAIFSAPPMLDPACCGHG